MIDYADYIRYIAALILVIAMIIGLAALLRRFGNSKLMGGMGMKRSDKRLRVVEVQPIDPRRRLILIAQDDVEHLLLVGPERDLVISTDRPARVIPTDGQAVDVPSDNTEEPTLSGSDQPAVTPARYIPGSRATDFDDGRNR